VADEAAGNVLLMSSNANWWRFYVEGREFIALGPRGEARVDGAPASPMMIVRALHAWSGAGLATMLDADEQDTEVERG
jgi:hypothetical protein